jgi:hypothetical protein
LQQLVLVQQLLSQPWLLQPVRQQPYLPQTKQPLAPPYTIP